jgi:RNA polymerase Rpb1, domain 6
MINTTKHTTHQTVNLQRLIWNAQKTFKIDVNAETSLNPADVVKSVKALCAKLVVVTGTDKLSEEAQHNATLMFHILVRRYVARHFYTRGLSIVFTVCGIVLKWACTRCTRIHTTSD